MPAAGLDRMAEVAQAGLEGREDKVTFARRELWPIRPIRQALPLNGPRPPPISMPQSLSSRFRTVRSSIPSGIRTQLSCGSRWPSDRRQGQAHRGQAGLKRPVVLGVPGDAGLQPLLDDQREGLAQGVVHADRRGVVVEAVASPVALDHLHVEIPALHLGLPLVQRLDGPRTERDGGQARRAAQALLRARVDRVDLPGVDLDRNARRAR